MMFLLITSINRLTFLTKKFFQFFKSLKPTIYPNSASKFVNFETVFKAFLEDSIVKGSWVMVELSLS